MPGQQQFAVVGLQQDPLFTASTSFANPAVTVARALTDTFSGIAPMDVPLFIAAQLLGGFAAAALVVLLDPHRSAPSEPANPSP